MVDGLTVYARLVASPDLSSALYLQFSDDALRAIKAELDCDCRIQGPQILDGEMHFFSAAAFVQRTDERFIFFMLHFCLIGHGDRGYYLIYDSVAASLSMISLLPEQCQLSFMVSPLYVPLGGGGAYKLLLLSRKLVLELPEPRKEDVLCVWSPSATKDEEHQWQVLRVRVPPEQLIPNPFGFTADVIFSAGGKAFWADLRQGLVYCDCPPADGVKALDFDFIPLPHWCLAMSEGSDFTPIARDRTIAFVNGAIRFVCIDRCSRPSGNVIVSVWDLDLETRVWKYCKSFLTKELWSLWTFKMEGLPETEPKFPILMPDGTLCLLMNWDDPTEEDYICNVELSSFKVLWTARLGQYYSAHGPVVLPSDFFAMLNPLDSWNREFKGILIQDE